MMIMLLEKINLIVNQAGNHTGDKWEAYEAGKKKLLAEVSEPEAVMIGLRLLSQRLGV